MKKVKVNNGGTFHVLEKGETANPNGRPRKLISDVIAELEAKGVKETNKTEVVAAYMRLINLSQDELVTIKADASQPALVYFVADAILSGKGFEIIEKMLDRSIGKAEQKTDSTIKIQTAVDPFKQIRENAGINE